MDELVMLDLGKQTLITALMIVAPALLVGMFTGLSVSLFQTITALQEQTLSIVPKMFAVVMTLIILMPWILSTLHEFAYSLFTSLAYYGPVPPT